MSFPLTVGLALLVVTPWFGLSGCRGLRSEPSRPCHQELDLREAIQLHYDGRPELSEVLPVVEPRYPFHEILLSWNADTTPKAGVEFELRVGRGVDGWSPWLYFGEWNTSRSPEACTEFESGRVDVDYFTSDVYWERIQIRVTARFSDDALRGERSRVDRLHLCFTDRYALPELETRPPRARAPLAVPSLSQREQDPEIASRICSPTSVAMALSYAGVDVTPKDVAARAYDANFDLFGNWPRAIQSAYTFGAPGYLTRFASWKPVERLLAKGHVVILSVAFGEGELAGAPMGSSRGHLLLVCGFSEEGDVIVNDPAAATEQEVRRRYSRDQLSRAWQGHGGTAYVFEVSAGTADGG